MSTQQMRNWYPELVVGGVTSTWVVTGSRPICDYTNTTRVRFYADGAAFPNGYIDLRFHPSVAPWARALAAVFYHHRYAFRETAGGSVSCRKITNGSRTSPHCHGIAMDINPSKNRYRIQVGPIQLSKQTDMPIEMVQDAEAIRTTNGKPVTQWGGRWTNIKDPMHYECSKCSRTDLETGIDDTTVTGWDEYRVWASIGPKEDDEMTLKNGDQGNAIKKAQKALNAALPGQPAIATDGIFGDATEALVKIYQANADLPESGVIDGLTMALLMEYMVDVADPTDTDTGPLAPFTATITPID